MSITNSTDTESATFVRCLEKNATVPKGYYIDSNPKGRLAHLKDYKVCTLRVMENIVRDQCIG